MIAGRTILNKVEARVGRGEIVTLIGPNGAGKTTLIKVMLGLVRAHNGRVRRRAGLRIGYMPQRLVIDPSMPLDVNGFLSLGLGRHQVNKGRRARVLAEVGAERVADNPIQNISGGELQRVLLARALLRDPDVLVLDEPVQGVDVWGQTELYALIRRLRDERGCGVLMVSHDLHMVMAATDQVVCLNHHVCCAGHPQTVSRDPEFVALFGSEIASELAVYHHDHDHTHG
ncbi:MAG TPA: metal ABC transporter ATP-binding protein [Rhodospirillales bacterium]|nr:metal ABC transporter ATP-binding protein [Rhodospirillales bacterium]